MGDSYPPSLRDHYSALQHNNQKFLLHYSVFSYATYHLLAIAHLCIKNHYDFISLADLAYIVPC